MTVDLAVLKRLTCSHGNTIGKMQRSKVISTSFGEVRNISGILDVEAGLRKETDVNIGKLMLLKIL